MLTREKVLEALGPLPEPTLRKGLTELGLVRDIVIRGNKVSMSIALHPDSLGRKADMERQITSIFSGLGAAPPHIRFREMTEHELAAAGAAAGSSTGAAASGQAGGARAGAAGQGTGAGAGAAQGPVQGHGAGLEVGTILDPAKGVEFIAVASGKGGVGKSTVTVNLAVALARRGKRVGVIDADIYGFSVPDMMGIEEGPQQAGDKILPVERFGVKVISMGFFVQDNSPVVWRGPMLGRMLRNFFAEIEWGELDYMLLDLPPGTGDIALDVHQMIPQSKEIIVTTPHATAAFVAARAGAMALKTSHEILGVVENMAWYECGSCGHKDYIFGRGGGGKLAETLHTELLAQFPLGAPDNHPAEPDFSPSVYKADTAAGQEYLALADKIIARCGK